MCVLLEPVFMCFQCKKAPVDCMTSFGDLPDFTPRQISRARSVGSLRITMEDVAPNGSTVTVTTGEYIC